MLQHRHASDILQNPHTTMLHKRTARNVRRVVEIHLHKWDVDQMVFISMYACRPLSYVIHIHNYIVPSGVQNFCTVCGTDSYCNDSTIFFTYLHSIRAPEGTLFHNHMDELFQTTRDHACKRKKLTIKFVSYLLQNAHTRKVLTKIHRR